MGVVCLGNVSIDEFIRRTGYNISKADRKILEAHRQDNATIEFDSDKFHVFDIPFSIVVSESFNAKLVEILVKYEAESPSKEKCSVSIVKETEDQKASRLKKEKEQQEWQDTLTNPNSIWNVKWHMMVPVTVNGKECFYGCFINTYTTGRENIPDTIDGKAWIRKDEEGLHGTFTLSNPDIDNDADEHPDWCYVIGTGFYSRSGNYIGQIEEAYFEETQFSLREAINNIRNFDKSYKETHFSKFKD